MADRTSAGGRQDALVTAAVERMDVGVVIVDGDARVTRYNPAAARLLGGPYLATPVDAWSRWWQAPTPSGETVPLAGEFPAMRALRGDAGSLELVLQGGALAGARFAITATPLDGAGNGAVVTFTRVGAAALADPAVARGASPSVDAVPPCTGVLLVEPDPEQLRATARILHDAGHRVVEATSASEAMRVAVATAAPLHVLLTDLILEDETGPELAHQLLTIRPGLSILYMSDHPWGALVPSSDGGGPGLLRKPLAPDALVEAVRAATRRGDRPAVKAPASLGRVLLVDDDEGMRAAVSAVLRDEGFEVLEADDGRKAIERVESTEVDVVLSDINMPGMTGIDLLKAIRAQDVDLPVILMTAAPRIDSASTAVEYGAWRYLTKPVEAQELVDAVQLAIRTGRFARLRRDAQAIAGHDAWRPSDAAGLDARLDRALGDLWLEYQPLVRADDGAVFAFEALVRTGEPSLRTPPMLLAAADQQRRTHEIGRDIRRLAAAAIDGVPPGVDLHVNINPLDLDDPELYAADAPLSKVARRVVLELSERQSLPSGHRFETQIRDLRKLGFRFALDDLGSGQAGLATFSVLAPEMVKLDPSLVRGIHATPAKRRTIAAMVALCRDMRIEVVAEGVELDEERACLVALGCDRLQGHLFARPSRELVATGR